MSKGENLSLILKIAQNVFTERTVAVVLYNSFGLCLIRHENARQLPIPQQFWIDANNGVSKMKIIFLKYEKKIKEYYILTRSMNLHCYSRKHFCHTLIAVLPIHIIWMNKIKQRL